ncbi:MAG: Holliday junction resolvase RuvX [Polyangiaceae bacterium]
MSRRRACGLDYGGARVGVAVSDELGLLAHPRPFLPAEPRGELLRALKELVREDDIERFVVGLPLDMKGGEGPSARKARDFAQELANAVGLDVELWDERLSTVQANRALQSAEVSAKKAKKRIDSASAVVILQAWLDQVATTRGRP